MRVVYLMTMDAPLMFVRTVCGQIRGRNDNTGIVVLLRKWAHRMVQGYLLD